MNCDRIAGAYRWLEYLSFGRALEHCRFAFLPAVASRPRVLMLGEGDGRFLGRYLRANPNSCVDYLDASGRMTDLAQRRGTARFIQGDARRFVPDQAYDLIVTHFFLDCLTTREVDSLAARLAPALNPRAHWLISEFRIPPGGPLRWIGRLLVWFLYRCFAWTTGLETQRLPDHRSVLARYGFRLDRERLQLGGILVSELWVLERQ